MAKCRECDGSGHGSGGYNGQCGYCDGTGKGACDECGYPEHRESPVDCPRSHGCASSRFMPGPVACMLYSLVFALLGACTEPEPLSPVGRWHTTWTWVPGGCGISQPVTDDVTVSPIAGSAKYVATYSDTAIVRAMSDFTCTEEKCNLNGTRDATTSGTAFHFVTNFSVDVEGRITGSGSMRIDNTSTCTQLFNVAGALL